MPRKELVGKVVSNKMEKTVIVAVEHRVAHTRYEKQMNLTKRFKAHDEENKCQLGDRVTIQECRPLSRDKRWLVVSVKSGIHLTAVPGEETSK